MKPPKNPFSLGRTPVPIATPPDSKIGLPTSTDRNVASQTQIGTEVGAGYTKTAIDTYFTKAAVGRDTPIVYNGDNHWARVTLTLETAGPVVVGQIAQLLPVLSGRGMLLETGVPVTFTIAKGTRLYIQSTGVNRVKRVIEPVPWMEQLTGMVKELLGTFKTKLSR